MKPTCDICDGGGNFMATIGGLEYSIACPAAVHRARATPTPPANVPSFDVRAQKTVDCPAALASMMLDPEAASVLEQNTLLRMENARLRSALEDVRDRTLAGGAIGEIARAALGGAAPPVPREPRTSHAEWFVSKLCRSGDHAICEAPKPCACSCHPRDPKTGELLAPPDEAKEPTK